jgi:hypothetical protein
MRFPGFVGGSNTVQSLTADSEETINLYIEKMQSEAAANVAALFPTPGFRRWTPASIVPDVGGRGALFANGRLFFVMGAGFYEFDINGVPTKRGTVALDANPAQIVFNSIVGGQLGIASGGNIYSYDLTTNVLSAPVLAGGFSHLAYAAGFGLALNPTTGFVRVSDLNNFTVWDPGVFFRRSLFADPYQAMWVDSNNLVWLVGTDSFEVRYNDNTGADQPFAPLSGLVGRYGIVAPFAFGLSGLGNTWMARNPEGIGEFVITRGATPTPIDNYSYSTAIAAILRTSRVDDVEVLMYQQEAHTFANIALPSASTTWSVDVKEQSWGKRGKWNAMLGRYDLWSPRVHCVAFGKHLVADRTTGAISEMDTNIATEISGEGIRRLRRCPFPSTEHKRIPVDQFELLMDVGVGVQVGQGSDPQAMLRLSTDAGRTWGNELQASVGRIGEFARRCYWTQLGALTAGVAEVTYSEPTPFRIVDALINNAEAA